jgi:hypothetical protein
MRSLAPSRSDLFFLNGEPLRLGGERLIGARVLRELDPDARIPGPMEPPYLFCGNGTCRDCNLSIDGLPELPSCRLPLTAGLSLCCAGEGALPSRIIPSRGEPLRCDVLVVGAGEAGDAVASAARAQAADVVHVEARIVDRDDVRSPCTAVAEEEDIVVFEGGHRRPVRASAVVVATGWHDVVSTFPGSTRPGVMPLDLLERYVTHGFRTRGSVLLVGCLQRTAKLRAELVRSGALRVETSSSTSGADDFEIVAVEGRRQPCLSLAKALGCRILYDRALGYDRLDVSAEGGTSLPTVFAAGSAFDTRGDVVGRAAARSL